MLHHVRRHRWVRRLGLQSQRVDSWRDVQGTWVNHFEEGMRPIVGSKQTSNTLPVRTSSKMNTRSHGHTVIQAHTHTEPRGSVLYFIVDQSHLDYHPYLTLYQFMKQRSGGLGKFPAFTTLPEHFKNNGYLTMGVGKLFHDGGYGFGGQCDIDDSSTSVFGLLEDTADSVTDVQSTTISGPLQMRGR